MNSRLVETAGGRTKVRVYEGGSGAPLLFLPGVTGLFPDDPFLAALAARHRVAAPLLPGYEDSEGAENLRTMQDVTLWAFDLLEALGIEKPLVVGHSLGGMIAAEMAALCPREVERLVLVAPAGLWLDAHPIPDLFATLPFELPALLFHDRALGTKLLTGGLPPEAARDASGKGAGALADLVARFDDVHFPRKWWWVLTPIKFAAAAGLVAGIWIPYLGLVTCVALAAYFLVAIGMHVAARDFGRNLFVNATGMLVICVATTLWCFLL